LKAIYDRFGALGDGLAAIREQYKLPAAFPAAAEAEAKAAAARTSSDHADRTALPFVTLDPLSATDLDQAFAIETSGPDLLLYYAIADVGWFVAPGGAIDQEAWLRGVTIYLPDGKVSLYPNGLGEGAASLLPDGARPSILYTVRIDPEGNSRLDSVERAMISSRAKLGYATVKDSDLPPGFADLSRRIEAAETRRGAARIDPPQQQVVALPGGGYALDFRPMSAIEQANAALSLAANLAIADTLMAAKTGLFRVMAEPGKRAISRLRHTAKALGLDWPGNMKLEEREKSLDPNDKRDAAFMLAIRRAGSGARYAPFVEGERPWHAAMAATYAHGTAPLRRLADRYVNEAALAVANGRPVPDWVSQAFALLPDVMNRAESRAAQVDGAVIELAEAVTLEGRVGDRFEGRVVDIDERGAKVQLCTEVVVTRLPVDGLDLGQEVTLELVEDVPARRLVRFELASAQTT
jgi:exoribonuclease R